MKMEAIQKRVDTNQEVEGEYLTYLLSNTKMTNKEVYGSVAELLLAGVDTVSKSAELKLPSQFMRYVSFKLGEATRGKKNPL